jgi:hypothetical protein
LQHECTFEEVISFVDPREAANPEAAVVHHSAIAQEVNVGRRPASVVPAFIEISALMSAYPFASVGQQGHVQLPQVVGGLVVAAHEDG